MVYAIRFRGTETCDGKIGQVLHIRREGQLAVMQHFSLWEWHCTASLEALRLLIHNEVEMQAESKKNQNLKRFCSASFRSRGQNTRTVIFLIPQCIYDFPRAFESLPPCLACICRIMLRIRKMCEIIIIFHSTLRADTCTRHQAAYSSFIRSRCVYDVRPTGDAAA